MASNPPCFIARHPTPAPAGIKRTVAPPLIVLPLLPITAVFWLACHSLFRRAQQVQQRGRLLRAAC